MVYGLLLSGSIGMLTTSETQPSTLVATMTDPNYKNWHIPRPSLVIGRVGDKESGDEYSVHNWVQHHHYNNLNSNSDSNAPSGKNSSSSQKSTVSAHSIASSGTLLLTAANLAAIQPPTLVPQKQKSADAVSVASSTHFTVVNGLGRSVVMYKKSWCARHQLTVLVCTMSFLFMVGLLAGVLYMESKHLFNYTSIY
ncbi:GSCOCG00006465001-RA-CDS [Cotesia congregata]|nr:GSCOCG00006465001-RA-CDS [Cotesia congregata]